MGGPFRSPTSVNRRGPPSMPEREKGALLNSASLAPKPLASFPPSVPVVGARPNRSSFPDQGRRWRVRTEPLGQTMVSVSLPCFITLSFELTMNQLFCVAEAPSLTVLATPSDWHVDELRASVPPGPTPLMILLIRSE